MDLTEAIVPAEASIKIIISKILIYKRFYA